MSEHQLVAVEALKSGDYVDFENDQYADPFGFGRYDLDNQESRDALNADHDYEADHMYFECELVLVEGVVAEGESVIVYTDITNVAFPRGHKVKRYTPDDEGEHS